MAYKKKNKKRGPIKKTYTYLLAKQVVQSQGITSKRDFERWWNYNVPKGIPKRPDIVYKRETGRFSWSEFLGIKNEFPIKRVKFRDYEECKKFTYTLGLKNSLEWFKYCKSKEKPIDIPNAPMHYYSKKGDWVSWKDFLGYNIAERHNLLINMKRPILIISRPKNRPYNIIKIGTVFGDKDDIMNYQREHEVQLIKCFYLNKMEDDWLEPIKTAVKEYNHGDPEEYFTSNISYVLSELSDSFSTVM